MKSSSVKVLALFELERAPEQSQEDYCRGCACFCNVILGDGESCGDRVEAVQA